MGLAMPTMKKDHARNEIYRRASHILGRIKSELVGRDVADREWLWSQRYVYRWWGHVSYEALAMVDDALWDLAGKATGLPVHRLLGTARETVPAYASCPYVEDPEETAALALRSRELGYAAFKIKPGGGPVSRVKRITRLCREAVGDDLALMLDGQMQFDLEQALDIGRHLQELGYEWWEDAVPHNRLDWYDELAGRLSIPLAYTDHPDVRFEEIAEILRSHPGIRIVRGDTPRDGVTGLKKLCTLAEAHGRNCEIHSSSSGNFHVLFSVTNCDYWEDCSFSVDASGKVTLERAPEDAPKRVDDQGLVHAPTSPGLGERIDVEAVERERVERLC
jgi:L-alanine-DL-glutamate epimerase-like enolase superfamily enzyme